MLECWISETHLAEDLDMEMGVSGNSWGMDSGTAKRCRRFLRNSFPPTSTT